jgi:hypothetical protein
MSTEHGRPFLAGCQAARHVLATTSACTSSPLSISALFIVVFMFVVQQVPSREILLGGGNIHCVTQQVPCARRVWP